MPRSEAYPCDDALWRQHRHSSRCLHHQCRLDSRDPALVEGIDRTERGLQIRRRSRASSCFRQKMHCCSLQRFRQCYRQRRYPDRRPFGMPTKLPQEFHNQSTRRRQLQYRSERPRRVGSPKPTELRGQQIDGLVYRHVCYEQHCAGRPFSGPERLPLRVDENHSIQSFRVVH